MERNSLSFIWEHDFRALICITKNKRLRLVLYNVTTENVMSWINWIHKHEWLNMVSEQAFESYLENCSLIIVLIVLSFPWKFPLPSPKHVVRLWIRALHWCILISLHVYWIQSKNQISPVQSPYTIPVH